MAMDTATLEDRASSDVCWELLSLPTVDLMGIPCLSPHVPGTVEREQNLHSLASQRGCTRPDPSPFGREWGWDADLMAVQRDDPPVGPHLSASVLYLTTFIPPSSLPSSLMADGQARPCRLSDA